MAKRGKKKDESDETFVICQLIEPGAITVPGTMERACSKCGRAVWLSRATEAAVAGREANLICIPCCKTLDPEGEDMEWQPPTPGQLNELRSVLSAAELRDLQDQIPSGSPARRRRLGRAILKELLQRRRRTN